MPFSIKVIENTLKPFSLVGIKDFISTFLQQAIYIMVRRIVLLEGKKVFICLFNTKVSFSFCRYNQCIQGIVINEDYANLYWILLIKQIIKFNLLFYLFYRNET
jgi:hypothetical protein